MKEGTKAPEFALKDKDGKTHRLSEMKTDWTVIYFYPKDDTTGCTIEAKEFSEHIAEFHKTSAEVIGISGLDEKSKKKFCDKYDLRVILLADPDFSVCKKYKVYGKKIFMGRKYIGIYRTTFVLDKNKKIVKVYPKVKALGHAKEVIDFIKSQS